MSLDLSRASQEMASIRSTDLRLFYCPTCGGVWWAVFAPTCFGDSAGGHSAARMPRANHAECGNTPGLVVEP